MTRWIREKATAGNQWSKWSFWCLVCPLRISIRGRPPEMMKAWASQIRAFMQEHVEEEHPERLAY